MTNLEFNFRLYWSAFVRLVGLVLIVACLIHERNNGWAIGVAAGWLLTDAGRNQMDKLREDVARMLP